MPRVRPAGPSWLRYLPGRLAGARTATPALRPARLPSATAATAPPSAFRSRAARTMVLGRGGTWHPTSSESVSHLLSGTAQSLGYDRVRRAQDPGQASHLDWTA